MSVKKYQRDKFLKQNRLHLTLFSCNIIEGIIPKIGKILRYLVALLLCDFLMKNIFLISSSR